MYSLPTRRMLSTRYGDTDEDTAVIARAVALGLQANGMTAATYPLTEDEISSIANVKAGCIFNLIEWCGRDLHLSRPVYRELRSLKVPVTGSSERLYNLSSHKIRLKKELEKYGITTPRGIGCVTGEEDVPADLPYPVLVKPAHEHCSIGLSDDALAYDEPSLRRIVRKQIAEFDQPVLAEEFIEGREFEVYVVEEKSVVRVLPIEEIIFTGKQQGAFQTYSAKWEEESVEYQNTKVELAQLTSVERHAVEKVCIHTFRSLRFYGYARFDVRIRDGVPYILEANANPAVYDGEGELTDPHTEVIWGISFADYIKTIVDSAVYHHRRGDEF